jgi:hypothetical protein
MSNSTYDKFSQFERNKASDKLQKCGDLKTLAYTLYTYREFLTYSSVKNFIKGRRYEIEQRLTHNTEM